MGAHSGCVCAVCVHSLAGCCVCVHGVCVLAVCVHSGCVLAVCVHSGCVLAVCVHSGCVLLLLRVFHVEQMLCACTLFAVLAVLGAVAPHGAVTPWEFGRVYAGYRAVSVGVTWLARWRKFGGRASAFAGVRFRPPRPSTPSVARLRPRLGRPLRWAWRVSAPARPHRAWAYGSAPCPALRSHFARPPCVARRASPSSVPFVRERPPVPLRTAPPRGFWGRAEVGVYVGVCVGAFWLRVPHNFAMSGAQFAKNNMLKSMLTLFKLYLNEVTKRTKKV